MSETLAIAITLVVYKIALVVIGLLANRRTHDVGDFFLGGRRLGPWVAAISASASSSSAWTLLGVSGAAYAWGLGALWLFPACVGGFLLNWFVLAPRLRRHSAGEASLTVTDVLAGPPGRPRSSTIRWLCTAIVLLSLLAYVAAQFQGAGKTFHQTFDMSTPSAVLLGAGIIVLYTLLGGFWAVSITDTLQGLVMAAAALVVPLAALLAVGGPAALLDALARVDVPGYGSPWRGLPPAAGVAFVLGLLGIGLGYPGQPHVVNRFMAVRDEGSMVSARRIAIAWAVVMYTGMLVVGWCARVLLPLLSDPEVAFIETTRTLLHPVLGGVMIAAVLSAVMSTADSQLLVAASSVAHDLRRDDAVAPAPLRRTRAVVLGLSAVAVALALWGSQAIFSRVLFAWTAMGAAFGPLLLVIVVAGPVRPGARLGSIALGFALSVAAYSIEGLAGGPWERVMPFVVALAVAWWGRESSVGVGRGARP
ncbi:sodium/proline symporter [Paraliomyxa miuraensis]|uniref:sodium/proline symporter n=1 Tax=Paraliomyxa miuraensis TaxID=376150 RepID=UPI0022517C53|nr:sodium/proline symporter [Paraliomyxa miuraensis]MCX4243238.1 sodium/proline symporter [Paraliomyxa miuraensis]